MENETREGPEPGHAIAVVGGGPAALYAASKLAKSGHTIAIVNRDVRAGGLAEYGIYPSKEKMKSGLRRVFTKILADPRISYFGGISVGRRGALTVEELRAIGFGVVVVAVGAQGTKWLGLPNEQAEGVFHAKDLVYHYNGLPPFSERPFAIGRRVAIVGLGNVALDIVHWLVRERRVEEVCVIARRGPAERACTDKELKLVAATIDLDALREEADRIADRLGAVGQDAAAEMDAFVRAAEAPLEFETPSSLSFRFLLSPSGVELGPLGEVRGLRCDRTRLLPPREVGGRPGVESTGESEIIACDTIVFAIGDRIEPGVGLPLDPRKASFATVPAPRPDDPEAPRYMVYDPERETPLWGTFVVGWARKASDGLVGKARADAERGAREIEAYLEGQLGPRPRPVPDPDQPVRVLRTLLKDRGLPIIDAAALERLEARERAESEARGVERYRASSARELLAWSAEEPAS